METKRVFIAIKVGLNNELTHAWLELKHHMREERIRWVPENNLHLTLRFLGNLPLPDIEQVKIVLGKVCENSHPFSFHLNGISFFSHRGQPSVIFFKTTKNEKLIQLARELWKDLEHIDVVSNKKFTPHLTIGRLKRLKRSDRFDQSIKKFDSKPIQQVEVLKIVLFESILKTTGAEYREIVSFNL